MILNKTISQTLADAYAPCPEFQQSCTEMQWNPGKGHVPRGFAGATGHLDEVELVLVFAEPGDPHDREAHIGIATAYQYATDCFKHGKDQFHRNVRAILNMCWPDCSFEEQMRKAWLTDSVLCSARIECGQVSTKAARACAQRFLIPQLRLFPNALIVALGKKPQERLSKVGVSDFLAVFAAAPPGCNQRAASASWELIPLELAKPRRSDRTERKPTQ